MESQPQSDYSNRVSRKELTEIWQEKSPPQNTVYIDSYAQDILVAANTQNNQLSPEQINKLHNKFADIINFVRPSEAPHSSDFIFINFTMMNIFLENSPRLQKEIFSKFYDVNIASNLSNQLYLNGFKQRLHNPKSKHESPLEIEQAIADLENGIENIGSAKIALMLYLGKSDYRSDNNGNKFLLELLQNAHHIDISKFHKYEQEYGDLQVWKNKYLDKILSQPDSLIPQTVKNNAKRILDNTSYHYKSPLLEGVERKKAYHHKTVETAGSFDPKTGNIIFSRMRRDAQGEPGFIKILFHELNHLLSSSSPRKASSHSELVINGRYGFDVTTNNKKAMSQFMWLNEAVTEDLNSRLGNESDSYLPERELLNLLLSKGVDINPRQPALKCKNSVIPETVLMEAYFEDRDPNAPPQQQQQRLKNFRSSIDRAYSKGFLNRLDSVVRFAGVSTALKILNNPNFQPTNPSSMPFLRSEEDAKTLLHTL